MRRTYLIAVACLSFDQAWRVLARGFEQIIRGAILPLSQGHDYVHSVVAFVKGHPFITILGATAAKECAFNLLPIPPLSGGYALLAILDSLLPLSEKLRYRAMLIGFLCLVALMVGWMVAVISAMVNS